MSETELLDALLKGRSEEAFAEFVRRYTGLVHSTARRRLGNPALAEDITQLVFIRFSRKPPGVRNQAELAAWLHRTTVNVTIDLWRSETRRRARELQAAVMEPATPDTVVWEEISPKLDEALNQLGNDDRQTLLLRFFSGKTMRELGATLGISEDAAKMRVSRAVERLRTQMGLGAACTAVGLTTLLAEHSVEAASGNLASRISSMKLPAAGVATGFSVSGALLRIPLLKLASMALVLALLVAAVYRFHTSRLPIAPATKNSANTPAKRMPDATDYEHFEAYAASTRSVETNFYFQIIDSESRQPLAGAKVHMSEFIGTKWVARRDFITGDNGVAVIPGPIEVAEGRGVFFYAVAEGHVPKEVSFQRFPSGMRPLPSRYTMDLYPALTVHGMVEDEQGKPVSGVKIFIENLPIAGGYKQEQQVGFGFCPVTSGGGGEWSYSYVPKYFTNQIPFILSKPGSAMTLIVVPVPGADLNNLVFVINRGFTVIGRVMDGQQQPVFKASVETLADYPETQHSVKTDESGTFVMTNISGLDVSRLPPCYTIKNENGELNTVCNFSHTATFETNEYGVVSLHEWIAENTQSVNRIQSMVPVPGVSALRNGASGGRSIALGVEAKGFSPQAKSVGLTELTNVVSFTLLPGNRLRGRVLDEKGNPIANVHVEAPWDVDNFFGAEWQTRTGTNGRFEWDSAPAGPVILDFVAEEFQPRTDVSLIADGSEHDIAMGRMMRGEAIAAMLARILDQSVSGSHAPPSAQERMSVLAQLKAMVDQGEITEQSYEAKTNALLSQK